MANITAAMVKELRETSGAGMLDCKKALVESDGNLEAAIDWLRQKERMSDLTVIVGVANGVPLWRMGLDLLCLWRARCARRLHGNTISALVFVLATIPLFGPCIVLGVPFAIQLVRILKLPHVEAYARRRIVNPEN